MKKKLLFLSIVMLLSMANAFAQSGTTGPLTWNLNGGTLTISGSGAMPNYSGTSAPWYSYSSSIKSVVIENGVTSIGSYAFYLNKFIKLVEIPNSVISIGNYAFYRCDSLLSVEIPSLVTTIGERTFEQCISLTSIEIPNLVTTIGNYAFYGCSSISSVEISNSLATIPTEIFRNCTSLTSVNIPSSVTFIAAFAFENCNSLASLKIPSSVTFIASNVFANCVNLTDVYVQWQEEPLPYTFFSAFQNVPVSEVNLHVPYGTVGLYLAADVWKDFNIIESSLSSTFTITATAGSGGTISPSGAITVYSGESQTFTFTPNDCSEIDQVLIDGIPNSIAKEDKYYTFENVTIDHTIKVTFITVTTSTMQWEIGTSVIATLNFCDSTLTVSGTGAMLNWGPSTMPWYSNRNFISNVIIEDGVTTVGNYAFYYHSNMKSVIIGNSVTSIGISAFDNCTNLKTLTMGNSVMIIENTAFRSCSSITSVTIPNLVTSIGNSAFQNCFSLTTVNFNATNCTFMSNSNSNPVFLNCNSFTTLNIGNNVTNIPDFAFSGCYCLTPVEIPNSVIAIGSYAFNEVGFFAFSSCNSFTSVVIPNSVISIGVGAFMNCTHLSSVTIGNSVTTIESSTFFNCYNLSSVTFGNSVNLIEGYAFANCHALPEIMIPNSVITIGVAAFNNCNSATSLTIGNSVVTINGAAFEKCSSLSEITSYPTIPPTITFYNTFDFVSKSIPVYVPCSSLSDYQTASYWNSFTNFQSLMGEEYTINATAGANGTISPSGNVPVNCGANQTFTFTPANSCYEIDQVLVDNVNNPAAVAAGSYTFTNVTANHTISVTFKIKTYTINATAGANGTISPSGNVSVNCGANQTFTFAPVSSCYEIDQVLVNSVNNPAAVAAGSYTFTNVTANHTISVTFKIKTYTISATAGANGTISPSGNVSVNCGANQVFTFTPDNNYKIDQVLIDGENNPIAVEDSSFTFVNIIEAHSIEVTFKEIIGILELALSKIIVYPNPTKSELKVESGGLRIEKMEIFDIFGRNVGINIQVRPENSENETVINISHLPVGVYFLKINTEIGQVVKKVLKE